MTLLLGPDPSARSAPPPGMREQVMRAGLRRRRFAYAGAGSAGAVAIVALAGMLAGGTAGSDSLRIDQPATGASAQSSALAAVSGSTSSGTTAGTSSTGRTQPASPAALPQQPAAAPAPSGRPSATPANGHGQHGPMTRKDREFGQLCQGDYTGVSTGGQVMSGEWCVFVAPPAARSSTPNPVLTFTVCRSTTKDGGALNFGTAQEVELVISSTRTKKTLWTWSTGQRFKATRHVLHMGSSQCSDWETYWNWRDDRGGAIAKGEPLKLTAWSTSSELKYKPVATTFTA